MLKTLLKHKKNALICIMKTEKNINKKNTTIQEKVLIATITVLTLFTINPMEWQSFRSLSVNSVLITTILMGIGFLALVLRKDKTILVSFTACILLCSHLKSSQKSTFSYCSPTQESTQLRVATFTLNEATEITAFGSQIQEVEADLIAVQVPVQAVDGQWLKKQMHQTFPYYQKTVCGDSLAMIVLSKAVIKELDTLCFDDAISIAGIIQPIGFAKEVAFISTHLSDKLPHTEAQLGRLSNYIQEHYAEGKPFLTLNGTTLNAWLPEIKDFKNVHSLYDSRTDIDFSTPDKHIFYSSSLECTSFKSVFDGIGVVATYQLKKMPTVAAKAM